MTRRYIERPFKVKSTADDGTFVGYASVFGEMDSYRDVVLPGAFAATLKQFEALGRKVPMLWQHDTRSPIGVYTSLKEDDIGLLVEGECNMDVQKGRECHALMKQGALTGLSIGYNTTKESWDKDGIKRFLEELDLWEISPVTFPAGDSARISFVKSSDFLTSLSDCEKYLRDAGFSKQEATALVSRVKSLSTRSDSADGKSASISRALETLKSL